MKTFEEIIYPFNVAYIVFGDDHELDLGGEEAQALCNSEKFWDDYKRLLDTLTRDELRTVIDKLFREAKSFDETAKETIINNGMIIYHARIFPRDDNTITIIAIRLTARNSNIKPAGFLGINPRISPKKTIASIPNNGLFMAIPPVQ